MVMSKPPIFNIQIGTQVRFLDEVGQGLVVRFLSKERVAVKIESGFEIPYLIDQLVPVADPTKGKVKLDAPEYLPEPDPDPYARFFQKAAAKVAKANQPVKVEPPVKNEPFVVDPRALSNALNGKKSGHEKKQSKGHSWGEVDVEIDLHAEELMEFPKRYSNGQILQLQMDHFVAALDGALVKNAKRLVVIHGIGTGKLKSEIMAYLRTNGFTRVQDASYAKYGFGATEIILR